MGKEPLEKKLDRIGVDMIKGGAAASKLGWSFTLLLAIPILLTLVLGPFGLVLGIIVAIWVGTNMIKRMTNSTEVQDEAEDEEDAEWREVVWKGKRG